MPELVGKREVDPPGRGDVGVEQDAPLLPSRRRPNQRTLEAPQLVAGDSRDGSIRIELSGDLLCDLRHLNGEVVFPERRIENPADADGPPLWRLRIQHG